ncbi:hypothetical protein ABD440_13610 [Chromobacterium piscinae]|uniref:hypothetical protein n=1 Tax=Chromobacterium piscinae TaxID=686831 RepID=UPI0031FC0EB4
MQLASLVAAGMQSTLPSFSPFRLLLTSTKHSKRRSPNRLVPAGRPGVLTSARQLTLSLAGDTINFNEESDFSAFPGREKACLAPSGTTVDPPLPDSFSVGAGALEAPLR